MAQLVADYPLLRIALLVALFALVGAIGFFASNMVAARQLSRRRLVEGADESPHAIVGTSLRTQHAESAWLKLVNAIEKAGLSLVDTRDEDLRRRLAAAGYTTPVAPRVYTLIRLVSVVGLPLLMLFVLWAGGKTPSIFQLYLVLGLAAFMGLYAPSLFIRARADRRQREIVNAFPDALDLMTVCVEAGLGTEAALNRERNGRLFGWQQYHAPGGALQREEEYGERGVLLRRKLYDPRGHLLRDERVNEDPSSS